MNKLVSVLLLSALAITTACSDDGDPLSSGGQGTAIFTTWGEDYIETEIPPQAGGQDGFVDGWTVRYSKFLVVFGGITVADLAGNVAASMPGTRLVDNVKKSPKELVRFDSLPARAYERVSYKIQPADASTVVVAGDAADRDFMAQQGYSIYVEGSASKGGVTKTFKWGFAQTTSYIQCKAEQGGKLTEGLVVTSGGTDTSELTTHGDHFFYNRLQADPSGSIPTELRFDELAAADDAGDMNGEVTLDELSRRTLDLKLGYDPSGFPVTDLRGFVSQLSRTVGHYRGEGECEVR